MARLGVRDEQVLLLLAAIVGVITGAAAVGFHELINWIRDRLYERIDPSLLYSRWLVLLVLFPAMGGLAVGLISRYVFRQREGHGIVDVIESVVRSSGFVKPLIAVEKILTSAITIGTGGSAGAEGPIVQIGAAISSGVGQLFNVTRAMMPILAGCGAAAGISAIFNAPIGGVLFALEVILGDFSLRTFTPVVVASVIANMTTRAIFLHLDTPWNAIFASNVLKVSESGLLDWGQVPNFIVLGLICGAVGVAMTRLMYLTEERFSHLKRLGAWRPAMGGALLGLMGVGYILVFGHLLALRAPTVTHPNVPAHMGASNSIARNPSVADDPPSVVAHAAASTRHDRDERLRHKPFADYSMPAFYGDGYDVVRGLLAHDFYTMMPGLGVVILLACLCLIKVVATCVTLGSGGSGGVIAPSLFLGATAGAVVGILLQDTQWFPNLQPELYALVGMGAVLAAVIHAPLASILICFEVTEDYKVMVPAMLACVFATGFARLIFRDSIYTLTLRLRGVRVGSGADLTLLRRLTVEEVDLEPATVVRREDPFQKVLDISRESGTTDFVVLDSSGAYAGMVVAGDVNTALMEREAVPLLLVGEIMRPEIPTVASADDLLTALDAFNRYDVSRLPVTIRQSGRIIGLISRSALMRMQQRALAEG